MVGIRPESSVIYATHLHTPHPHISHSHTVTLPSTQHLLEKEHCEENILFWRDAEEFKQKAPQMKNVSGCSHTHTHTLISYMCTQLYSFDVLCSVYTSKADVEIPPYSVRFQSDMMSQAIRYCELCYELWQREGRENSKFNAFLLLSSILDWCGDLAINMAPSPSLPSLSSPPSSMYTHYTAASGSEETLR